MDLPPRRQDAKSQPRWLPPLVKSGQNRRRDAGAGGHEHPGAYALDLSRGTGIMPTVRTKGTGMSSLEGKRRRRRPGSKSPNFRRIGLSDIVT